MKRDLCIVLEIQVKQSKKSHTLLKYCRKSSKPWKWLVVSKLTLSHRNILLYNLSPLPPMTRDSTPSTRNKKVLTIFKHDNIMAGSYVLHTVDFMGSIHLWLNMKKQVNLSALLLFIIWKEFSQRRNRKQPLIKFFYP